MAAAANFPSTKCPTYKNSDSFDSGNRDEGWEGKLSGTFEKSAGADNKMSPAELVKAIKAALDKPGLDIVLGIIDALSDNKPQTVNKPQLHKTWGDAPPGPLGMKPRTAGEWNPFTEEGEHPPLMCHDYY